MVGAPPEDDAPLDLEAARLRARMRANLFGKPAESVQLGRFEVVRLLGSGAMGVVYEVVDPRSGNHLALKTVRSHHPRILSLFKKEFRALTRVMHPNLVALHELGRAGQHFFFTMELVRGARLLRYLWGCDEAPAGAEGPRPSPVLDFERLRACFSQLAAAVAALHEAGKLHRDIKPSNVMVTTEGRVVLMDLGFVSEQGASILDSTQGSMVVGTPAFMPPEQARGERLAEAADWYCVGATLYQALTGLPPFGDVGVVEAMLLKETGAPPSPRLLALGIPGDLAELCVALLQPDPAARPREPEVLARLHAAPWGRAAMPASVSSMPPGTSSGFVGRGLELRGLAAASAAARPHGGRPGRLEVVQVRGPAGIGKSALLACFVERLRADPARPRVVRARCSPRDAVPFQAIDGLVDALARHLRQLPVEEAAGLLPADPAALVGLFPVLSQVPALAAVRPLTVAGEAGRAAAFAGLRALLQRFAAAHPLVLWIDDLHWGDLESSQRLTALMAPPEPPGLLLLLSYRTEEAEESPGLAGLAGLAGLGGHVLTLAPLGASEAAGLAAALLGEAATPLLATRLAEESGGSPLWIRELVRLRGAVADHELTLSDLVRHARSSLDPPAQELLGLMASCRGALPLALARAVGVAASTLHSAVPALVGARLVRIVVTAEGEGIAPWDGRIRELLLAELDGAARRQLHKRLAEGLGRREGAAALPVIDHLRGAGELVAGRSLAMAAAAYEEAAGRLGEARPLLRLAYELGQEDAASRAILGRLAAAHLAVGEPLAAASLLESLARGGEGEEAISQQLAAAKILLEMGEIGRGRPLLDAALRALGLSASDAPSGALGSLLRRGALRLRGRRFRARTAAQVATSELLQVDALAVLASTAPMWLPERAAEAQERHLGAALRAGEPLRIARALVFEARAAAREPRRRGAAAGLLAAAEAAAAASSERSLALYSEVIALVAAQRGEGGGGADGEARGSGRSW
ncbi:MAG: AAA family ATPase [Nannocystis sp.]|nr:AAA family ATPase [Nannocystis sp.]